MNLTLKTTKGRSYAVAVPGPDTTVAGLVAAAGLQHPGVRVKTVVWEAKVLRAAQTLGSAGVRDGATCVVVLLPAAMVLPAEDSVAAAAQAAQTAQTAQAAAAATATTHSSNVERTRSANASAAADERLCAALDVELEATLSLSTRLRRQEARARTLVGGEEAAAVAGAGEVGGMAALRAELEAIKAENERLHDQLASGGAPPLGGLGPLARSCRVQGGTGRGRAEGAKREEGVLCRGAVGGRTGMASGLH